MGLPRVLLWAAVALFVVSLLGAVFGFGVFLWYDTDFWDYFDPGPVLNVAVTLSGGLAASSGILYFHFKRRATHITLEVILFGFVCFVSSCFLLWTLPAAVFG